MFYKISYYNVLNKDLNTWIYTHGYRLRKAFVVGAYKDDTYKLKSIIYTYGGYIYMSYCDTDFDPLFLERREILRGKNNFYNNRKKFLEERPKLIKELSDMGIKITLSDGKEIGKPTHNEIEKDLVIQKEKGIQGYLLNIK